MGYPPAGNTSASRERGLLRGGIPPGTEAGHSDFMVVFRGSGELVDAMHEEGLVECVIGVVYNTSTETTYVSTLYGHICFPSRSSETRTSHSN
ncbi:hypothetical protein BC938DRAFT_474680 [Jimgerdemannia flammicorona]|uniref:Uncharacterized protein n=1 Tax=Jimgerdemannia flammicorona TaxID=994334 RepID=A0A433Q1X1_9FUNG|nr:hypothetical protein BC938DRAFT_474680 [Jimgerdemannia flammicorona]